MSINIQSKNFQITRAVSRYLDKRINKINKFAHLDDPKTRLDIEVSKTTEHHKQGEIFRIELNLHVGGEYHRATAKELDIYSAIDIAQEELLRQLRKNKGKKRKLLKQSGAQIKKMLRKLYRRE